MTTASPTVQNLRYLLITIATFLAIQSAVVVGHEFTHSTAAWLLGAMESPTGIVWGNPVTLTGWDEGVDYSRLFAEGNNLQAAIIGFCPLVMHALISGAALFLMCSGRLNRRKWVFHFAYWLTVANLMELVAYICMRSFAGHGDTGIFDRGTGLSPWWLFLIGSAALTWALLILYRRALPELQNLFAQGNLPARWSMLILTSFILFLWGSGVRVMAYVEGPQWAFGLIGIPAFILTIIFFRPTEIRQ